MLNTFIIKRDENPLHEALGLHHATIQLAAIISTYLLFGFNFALISWGYGTCHYLQKELRENGDKFEIFDFLTPLSFGVVALALLQ